MTTSVDATNNYTLCVPENDFVMIKSMKLIWFIFVCTCQIIRVVSTTTNYPHRFSVPLGILVRQTCLQYIDQPVVSLPNYTPLSS